MKKGALVEVNITDLTNEGIGIGHVDGLAIFVKGATLGDSVVALIGKVKKNYALADTQSYISKSQYSQDKYCPYLIECGGCTFASINYDAQLELKRRHVIDKLKRIAGIKAPNVCEIVRASRVFRYRNKSTMAIDGKKIGFMAQKTHDVIDCYSCELQQKVAEAVANAWRNFVKSVEKPLYISQRQNKKIPKVITRTSFSTGEVMVIFDNFSTPIPNPELLVDMMYEQIDRLDDGFSDDFGNEIYQPELVSVYEIDNQGKAKNIAGKRTITDYVCGLKFEIFPQSFYQVNPEQTEKLYEKVVEYADLKGDENVLDLYCGVGTIGLILASRGAGKVVGIESVHEAVLAANRNAVINGIVNAVYRFGKAEELLDEIAGAEFTDENIDIAIIDPPRRGCDKKLIESLIQLAPRKILYVSCDPATMSRDIKLLIEAGYELNEATPVDMFPQSGHVEAVTLLTK